MGKEASHYPRVSSQRICILSAPKAIARTKPIKRVWKKMAYTAKYYRRCFTVSLRLRLSKRYEAGNMCKIQEQLPLTDHDDFVKKTCIHRGGVNNKAPLPYLPPFPGWREGEACGIFAECGTYKNQGKTINSPWSKPRMKSFERWNRWLITPLELNGGDDLWCKRSYSWRFFEGLTGI